MFEILFPESRCTGNDQNRNTQRQDCFYSEKGVHTNQSVITSRKVTGYTVILSFFLLIAIVLLIFPTGFASDSYRNEMTHWLSFSIRFALEVTTGINSRFPNVSGVASDSHCFASAGTTGIWSVLKPEDKSYCPCHNLRFPGTGPIGRKQPVCRKSALS